MKLLARPVSHPPASAFFEVKSGKVTRRFSGTFRHLLAPTSFVITDPKSSNDTAFIHAGFLTASFPIGKESYFPRRQRGLTLQDWPIPISSLVEANENGYVPNDAYWMHSDSENGRRGPQVFIVIILQKHINVRIGKRVTALRRATNRIVEEYIKEVEQAVLSDFDEVYEARRKTFLFKQSAKFALNAINGLGTAGVLILGGWLVLDGRSDIGIVVAALAGLNRIAQPWRELIAF